ncbi:MAG: tripartite tricarboxylate transporter receptor family protein [Ramlibacter sp.]|jgi:tripartite-type tricarboxylate transporter receptor subunit TctC|uniref:Bug family tripartite tricarboxylate transporter substrate binding protein n=1 Tax=Ramlibacter sp. TaxID=1917967 RepID=UPI002638F7D6|nr:tripartite tricarboxylate transporter substrate binding protein [Ramlibacter sp.]MDB5750037.1 tripartite tricarboxylate transporter receptor family protein [Ramlibacter sp.]
MTTSAFFQAAIAAGLCVAAVAASAQDYPSRPITFVVPFGAGGSADLTARTVARKLSDALGQPVVIDNRAGAGGEIGTAAVVRAPADGYTVLVTPNGPITTGGFFHKQPYNVKTDLVPLTTLSMIPMVLAVNAQLPVKTVAELVAFAKDKGVNYGNPGSGSINHLNMELLRHFSGAGMTAVPYKGNSAAAVAVAGGEVHVGSGDFTSFMPLGPAGAGKVRFIATFSPKRTQVAPEVPTVAEAGFAQFKPVLGWVGAFVPVGTPPAVVNRLQAELVKVLQQTEVRQKFVQAGMEAAPMTREQFGALVVEEIDVVGKQVRDAGIRLEK